MSTDTDPTDAPTGVDSDFLESAAATIVASIDGIRELRDAAEERLCGDLYEIADHTLGALEALGRVVQQHAAAIGLPVDSDAPILD